MAEHAQRWGGTEIVGRTHWYVLHCEPQRDLPVDRLVGNVGFETYAPRIPKTRKRNGDKPLFPGYVFVRLALTGGSWNAIRTLPGVRCLVEIGGGPCPVDDGIVEGIRQWVASRTPESPFPHPGDRVTITSGVFAHLDGVVCESLSSAERVAVLIDMMQRQVRVEIPVDSVELQPYTEVAA
jgi:transcription elongation factor/antiterminator RfaH